jgi:hypothetical protein
LNDVQNAALEAIKCLARQLPIERGRALTGLIGELSACNLLRLNWNPSSGYDATDKYGNQVQIKARRDSKGGPINSVGTVGRFTNFKFHYALYVELDTEFEPTRIYKIDSNLLRSLIKREDNAITVHNFRKHGSVVYQYK